MNPSQDAKAIEKIMSAAKTKGLDLTGATITRSSSRFCLGVEHGDYNGTDLFGIGTDRFIWFAYKPNGTDKNRLFSVNIPDQGIIEYKIGQVPPPQSPETSHSWARFPFGVDYILKNAGYNPKTGIDGIIYGNIPGGGMSRSASLTLNLIISTFQANNIEETDNFKIIDLAQAVENAYIGSPCGQLDQIMILFAKAGMGTYYKPDERAIEYIPLGPSGEDLRFVVMDTGTDRPGLDKSTYKVRREECSLLVELAQKAGFDISCLADVKDQKLYDEMVTKFQPTHPDLCKRLDYIYHAQQRFYQMLDAWKAGDIEKLGQIFRADGIGLRDDYKISGPELDAMCDIAATVPGVLGERMLGGGDKGASGALVRAQSVENLKITIDQQYPKSNPDFADKYAVHTCRIVDGITVLDGLI